MMNREIKFRIWWQQGHAWQEDILLNRDGQLILDFGESGTSTLEEENEDKNNFIIQQFTGLKDINGKEIYEGDIIKIRYFDGWFDKIGFLLNEIVFYNKNEGAFRLGTKSAIERGYSGGNLSIHNSINENLQVIGNICENPELCTE